MLIDTQRKGKTLIIAIRMCASWHQSTSSHVIHCNEGHRMLITTIQSKGGMLRLGCTAIHILASGALQSETEASHKKPAGKGMSVKCF